MPKVREKSPSSIFEDAALPLCGRCQESHFPKNGVEGDSNRLVKPDTSLSIYDRFFLVSIIGSSILVCYCEWHKSTFISELCSLYPTSGLLFFFECKFNTFPTKKYTNLLHRLNEMLHLLWYVTKNYYFCIELLKANA